MAGHSKWHNIKHRKAAQDAKKGKIYSLHSKLIALEAQKGGDPEQNPSLAVAISNAKSAGVPNDNIQRAIKKGTGEDKSAAQIIELQYEGYGPGGIAIIVRTLTDNKNRTAANIRHIFSKYGGNLGESGSVAWMFERKGVIIIDENEYSYDSIEELVFETQADDITLEDDIIKILTSPEVFTQTCDFFKQKDITLTASQIDYIPNSLTDIDDFDTLLKFKKMLEAFDEDEDVENVSSSEQYSTELSQKVDEFIEKNTFRT